MPPRPALPTKTSVSKPRVSISPASPAAAPGFARSAAMTIELAPCPRSSSASDCIGSTVRALSTRSWPSFASSRARSAPMPLDAPVTKASGRVGLVTVEAPGALRGPRRGCALHPIGGNLTVLQDKRDAVGVLQDRHVGERIPRDNDEVGELAFFDRTEFVFAAE